MEFKWFQVQCTMDKGDPSMNNMEFWLAPYVNKDLVVPAWFVTAVPERYNMVRRKKDIGVTVEKNKFNVQVPYLTNKVNIDKGDELTMYEPEKEPNDASKNKPVSLFAKAKKKPRVE